MSTPFEIWIEKVKSKDELAFVNHTDYLTEAIAVIESLKETLEEIAKYSETLDGLTALSMKQVSQTTLAIDPEQL